MVADLQQGFHGLVQRIGLQPVDAGVAHAAGAAQRPHERRCRAERAAAGRKCWVAGGARCLEASCAVDAGGRRNGPASRCGDASSC